MQNNQYPSGYSGQQNQYPQPQSYNQPQQNQFSQQSQFGAQNQYPQQGQQLNQPQSNQQYASSNQYQNIPQYQDQSALNQPQTQYSNQIQQGGAGGYSQNQPSQMSQYQQPSQQPSSQLGQGAAGFPPSSQYQPQSQQGQLGQYQQTPQQQPQQQIGQVSAQPGFPPSIQPPSQGVGGYPPQTQPQSQPGQIGQFQPQAQQISSQPLTAPPPPPSVSQLNNQPQVQRNPSQQPSGGPQLNQQQQQTPQQPQQQQQQRVGGFPPQSGPIGGGRGGVSGGGVGNKTTTNAANPVGGFPPQNAAQNRVNRPNIKHSTVEQEKQSFAEYINNIVILRNDPALSGVLPLNVNDDSLFKACSSTPLICKLVNSIRNGTIDESKICTKPNINLFEINNNHELALSGARTLGCKITNIGPTDISSANPTYILAVLWQLIRIGLLSSVNLQAHPEIIHLKEESENVKNFVELSPETTLLRWVNHHLGNTAARRKLNNLSTDIMDSISYAYLLNQIAPNLCGLEQILAESDPLKRAELVLQNAAKLGCRQFISPHDIVDGNERLNLAFIANLFNRHPALERLSVLSPELEAQRAREVQDAVRDQMIKQEQELRQRMTNEEQQLRSKLQLEEQQWRRKMEDEELLRKKQWEEEDFKRRQQGQLLQEQKSQWEAEQAKKAMELQSLQQQQQLWEQQQRQKLEQEKQRIFNERQQLEEEQRLRLQQKNQMMGNYNSVNPQVNNQMSFMNNPSQSSIPNPATQMGLLNANSPFASNNFMNNSSIPNPATQMGLANSFPSPPSGYPMMGNFMPGVGTEMGFNSGFNQPPMGGGGFMMPGVGTEMGINAPFIPGVGTEMGLAPGAGGFNSLSFPSVPPANLPQFNPNIQGGGGQNYGYGPGQTPPYW